LFELKQSICYPGFGAKANEDGIGYGRNYCFVMDGASCLSGKNIIDPISDSAWMTKKVCSGLCELLDREDPRPTGELLRQVIGQVRREYVQAQEKLGVDAPEDSPSAGFALFRLRNGNLEFFGLGDCVGVAKLPNGEDFYALEENLPKLDQQVIRQMVKLREETGLPILEAKKRCNDLLIANRNLRNRPGGYWILDLLTDESFDNAREESWPLTVPVCVGALSDGFAQLTEVFSQYAGYPALFAAMQETDLEKMYRDLCQMQDADPDCNAYPRFKHGDDTSALWGVFYPEK